MAITIPFNGASLKIPGAYSSLRTNLIGALPLAETGIVGIIGESAKGAPGSNLAEGGIRTYDSTTLANLIEYYGSGPIVDAARSLVNASNDARVPQGASKILVYKTNASTQGNLVINQNSVNPWATITSQNFGVDENLINTTISQDTAETFNLQFGADWTSTPAADMTLRINGNALVTITAANCTSAAATVTELNSKINTALGTVAIAYASTVVNRISLNLAITGTGAHREGMGISLEFIASANWTLVGVSVPQQGVAIVAGSTVTGLTATNATRTIVINRQQDQINESTADTTGEIGGRIALQIGYTGTTGTLTITATTLTTTVTGGSGSNLNLTLSNFATLADLAQFIDSQTGYKCSLPVTANGGLPPSVLDRVSAVGICSTTASLKVGQIKTDSYEVQKWFDQNSQLVKLSRTLFIGLPDVLARTYLAGGTRGSSSTSSFNLGFVAFEGKRINIIVPLVSQDASDDLAETPGYTDNSSNYDVESIHTQAREHCKKMSSTVNRNERNCYIGYRGTFLENQNESKAINSEFCSLVFQDVQIIATNGSLVWRQPHMLAAIVAGMQAGGEIGLPMTHKYIAVNGAKHVKKQGVAPNSNTELFDANNLGHQNIAVENGLTTVESPSSGGVRIVLHNTTYQNDANFVLNRVNVLSAAHYVAYNLRQQLETLFVGDKVRTGTAETIRNAVIGIMKQFLDADIIVGDDTNKGLGWKNLSVNVIGNVANIDITITPVQGVEFVLARIVLDTIRQTA